MAQRRSHNLRYAVLSVLIAAVLWAIAHGGSTVEREFDIPVVFGGLPDELVITDRSVKRINVRVQGSRAAFRDLSAGEMEYEEDISGAKTGRARYEVTTDRLEMPRGLRVVGLSPAQIEVRFERRGRKSVRIRADLEGQPAEGFVLGEVEMEPSRVWLTGARSNVLRLSEVVTETIDVSGAQKPIEREVKLSMGAEHVWPEENEAVKVRIAILPVNSGAPAGGGNRS